MSVASVRFPDMLGLPHALLYLASPILIIATVLVLQKTLTTWSYYHTIRNQSHGGQKISAPAVIPYWIPWLGHTLSFLNQTPGEFWQKLFSWHPRDTGICTLVVGGRRTHIVYSPTTVQALFRAKGPNRDIMEQDMFRDVFLMSAEQVHTTEATKSFEVNSNSKYLNGFERVNELTAHFTRLLGDLLASEAEQSSSAGEVGLYAWLRELMFAASVKALFGEHLQEIYPTYSEDFFKFDVDVLRFLFRTPTFLMKDAIARRERMFKKLERWGREMNVRSGGTPVDPDEGPAWEPFFGSRFNRARQRDYKLRNLSAQTGAALDAGVTFGLASNAIPATGWMLFNILNPDAPASLLPRVVAEIEESKKPDGSLDIAILISRPLLQSIFTETLRVYTDVLVARGLPEDIVLPVDEDGKNMVSLRKGDFLLVPGWLGHRDNDFWSASGPSQDVFDAERFLDRDPKTGRDTFNMGRTAGKFFPFGGGKTICPGRTFAKQEAIGALAMILLRFEFDVKGFTDLNKKPTGTFPGVQSTLPGSGVLAPGGDMQVKIRRRE